MIKENELQDLVEKWRGAAEFAKKRRCIGEYDGIMGCVYDLESAMEDNAEKNLQDEAIDQLPHVAIPGSHVETKSGTREDLE